MSSNIVSRLHSKERRPSLEDLGAFGFKQDEEIILAALVTEDPLLLIGNSGTGKTFLLNSISEAMGLEHRHYNASLIAFDDLVGFPYPDEAKENVRFMETPATIWGSESVLVDEISRCKPEHQNRLFSLVHERKVQGISLDTLKYRWAAMNPVSGSTEDYLGSEALDPALADRFAVLLEVKDWSQLDREDQRKIAKPGSEGVVANDGGVISQWVRHWRREFEMLLKNPHPWAQDYACSLADALDDVEVRISPRRVRMLSRTLLACRIVSGREMDRDFLYRIVTASIPQKAWGDAPEEYKIRSAAAIAWNTVFDNPAKRWLQTFLLEKDLAAKAFLLCESTEDPDTGTLAIEQLISDESRLRSTTFAFATFPAALEGLLPIGAEGVNDLAKIAKEVINISGKISWKEHNENDTEDHPDIPKIRKALRGLKGSTKALSRQLLCWSLTEGLLPEDPEEILRDFHRCLKVYSSLEKKSPSEPEDLFYDWKSA
ncbi:MAG: AAA family ATPase [Candidatus Krumholzibacteria bacterium]|nr:AAA family ATPase [Candidatus Krumholzibacteria bacterium]MDP7022431.1 AAA family ATPase [Candidatus Krumholzibacteria bacterium]